MLKPSKKKQILRLIGYSRRVWEEREAIISIFLHKNKREISKIA